MSDRSQSLLVNDGFERVLHFAEDGDTSGFFPQLARWHDLGRYQMFFGTLKPMAPWLEEYMNSQGVATFSCGCKDRRAYPLGLLRLVRYLRKQQIDILHTHLFDPSVIGMSAGFLAGTPLRVLTRHYSDYHTRINRPIHVRLDQLCTRLSHAVIAVSEHTAKHLIDVEHADREKVVTVCNGIDFDRVRLSSPDAPKQVRNEVAPNGAHLLVIVARLHPEKGYEYLFQALSQLNQQMDRPVILVVAGRGTLLEHYRTMAESLGCANHVRFLGFCEEVFDLMAAADLMVLPSVAEAFGLVLTEALYLGTPVVATKVGGIPEIVSDGVDGVLVPPADSAALANAIVHLLNDPQRRAHMSGAGREKVQRKFRFEAMLQQYEQIYETFSKQSNRVLVHA